MDDVTKALFSATTADEVRDILSRGADPLGVQEDYPHTRSTAKKKTW